MKTPTNPEVIAHYARVKELKASLKELRNAKPTDRIAIDRVKADLAVLIVDYRASRRAAKRPAVSLEKLDAKLARAKKANARLNELLDASDKRVLELVNQIHELSK